MSEPVAAFIQARNYTAAARQAIDLVVLHTMESPEGADTAFWVAKWFAGPDAPRASAHYCVDADTVVQCVLDADIAWHAPGVNSRSIGIEHAGRANQTAEQWRDDYSAAVLARSIDLCADLCRKYDIPPVFVGIDGLIAGERGITTHACVSLAFHKSTHSDPGVGFPRDWYIAQVAARLAEAA